MTIPTHQAHRTLPEYPEGTPVLDPAALGFYEKRAGSGVWYHPSKRNKYRRRTCQECGREFMALRNQGKGRFCSRACASNAHRNEAPGYGARHERVKRARGRAADHACTDCGGRAADWSQIHGTTGLEPEHYEPRCRKCHFAYDVETKPRGETNGNAKLTEPGVRGIWASTGATQAELAEIYGIDKSVIRDIRNGEAWKHVTGGRRAEW